MDFRKSNLLAPGAALLLALYFTFPFLLKITYWGIRDWDLFSAVLAAPVGSVINYGQFPFWNPYMGGGNILFHHPEVGVFSPFFPLHLAFGIIVGLKLQVLVCYFIGFWGSQRLASRLGMSFPAALMTAVAYFGSVHFALHLAEGHIPFTHFCFLPWYLYFLLGSADKRKTGLALAAITIAVMILGNGAAVPLLYTLTLAAVFFCLLSVQKRRSIYIVNMLLSTIMGIALAAVKFVPMVIYLSRTPWQGNPHESLPLAALWPIFFGRQQELFATNFPGQEWGWHEYGAYISPVLLLLALAALIFRFRSYRLYLIVGVFFFLLGLGDFGAASPWSLLSRLPGFSSTRCTARAFQMVILSFALLGGFGFDVLREKVRDKSKFLLVVVWAAAVVIVRASLLFAWPIMSEAFDKKPEEVYRSPVFTQAIDKTPQAYRNFLANRGALVTPWLSAYEPSRALVDAKNTVLSELVASGRAVVERREYTPNIIEYDVRGEDSGRMVICMGYDPGWRADDGRPVTQYQRLIAFPFGPGLQKVILRYRTPYFFHGLAVSLLAVVSLAWWWRRR